METGKKGGKKENGKKGEKWKKGKNMCVFCCKKNKNLKPHD